MIRSTTSSLSAASTSPPPTTEPHGPGLSSFGRRSPVSRLPRRAGNSPPLAIFGRQVDGAAAVPSAEGFPEIGRGEAGGGVALLLGGEPARLSAFEHFR